MKMSTVYAHFDNPDKKLFDGPIDEPHLIHQCWMMAHGWCNHPGCRYYYLRLTKPEPEGEK